jgi:hypothetical protein
MHIPLLTSRFNNETWDENTTYKMKHPEVGCIYGAPQQIADHIALNTIVFVIEMNNQTNKIMGIGLIRNMVTTDKYYKVYTTGNYNRYVYMSKYHLERDTLEAYNSDLMKVLEYILFKGKTHLKRGSGFTSVPEKLLKSKVCQSIGTPVEITMEIVNMFKRFYSTEMLSDENNEENAAENK